MSSCTKKGRFIKDIEYKCIQQSATIYRIDKKHLFRGIASDGTKCDFWTDWFEYKTCASGQGCSEGKCVS